MHYREQAAREQPLIGCPYPSTHEDDHEQPSSVRQVQVCGLALVQFPAALLACVCTGIAIAGVIAGGIYISGNIKDAALVIGLVTHTNNGGAAMGAGSNWSGGAS